MKSSKLVNQYIWLVCFVGIMNISFLSGALVYVSLIERVVSFFIVIVVNGRIAHIIQNKGFSTPLQIIKENWINYLIVLLIVGTPVYAFNYLLKLIPLTVEYYILVKEAAEAIVLVITIYVTPIVFLRKLSFISIIVGISYFFKNFKQSMPIVPFVATMFLINAGMYLWAVEIMRTGTDMLNVIPELMLLNIVSTYLSFIIFASASTVLVSISPNIEEKGKHA